MRCLICATVLCLLPAATRAGDAKANTLTPAEVAEGWLLLFDGKTTFGWSVDGEGAVEKGALAFGGKRITAGALTTRFSSFEMRAECRCEGAEQARVVIKRGFASTPQVIPRVEGATGWDTLTVRVDFDPTQKKETSTITFVSASGNNTSNNNSSVDGVSGSASLRFEAPGGTKLRLRNVKLRPTEMKSIFNGKNLTGWKEFSGKKSKFTVNAKGELNVKNGPGDLQTDGKWDNFVLQLECISNGKHLNSGVFFRCRAGEYQNGYEAQIQNGYKGDDRTKPTDFGTGAIYRRVPARMVVPNDHEWFTMTVVADGKHLSTWVNGIQVVDWTDDRPLDDNARKGCCLNAGHISLQGHDPTTDLSFRNIRIVELKDEKKN
ncbi:MAG TPA: DUF1080 domain-containing protein [Gemmataceae bacterium]|nr:DUF1080 domain-containing protein [Gemmataceae bacterium]